MNSTNSSPNQMTILLNKIERRLGLTVLNLPEKLSKDNWCQIIEEDTLPEFSRFFPYKIMTIIDNHLEKDGYFFIDRCVPNGSTIIGIGDIAWDAYRCDPRFNTFGMGFCYDFAPTYDPSDIAFTQLDADIKSFFDLGIYIEFLPPNKIKLVSVNGAPIAKNRPFPLEIFVQHPKSLMTISPTMMRSFEELAMADVATFLYHNLKYYDGTDTVFMNIDLKLDTLQEWANKRQDILDKLEEAHVSAANEFQHLVMTV